MSTIPTNSATGTQVWLATASGAFGAAALTIWRATTTVPPADLAAAPWRAVRWGVAAHRARRQRAAAWREGGHLVRGVVALRATPDPQPGSQSRCPRCGGRRCGPWRDGLDCGPQHAPQLTTTLGGGGAHEAAAVLRRWVDVAWSPLSWDLRLWLAPARYERRLPAVIV